MATNKQNIEKLFNKAVKEAFSEQNMDALGKEIARFMKGRVRQGKSVPGHGKSAEPFKPLAESTVKARRHKRLGRFAKKSKSNLNETGEMVDSIHHKTSSPSTLNVSLTMDVGREHENKAEWHHEGAGNLPKRPFMFLSNKEQKRVIRELQDNIDDASEKVSS